VQPRLPLASGQPTSIMLIDDHAVLRSGLRRILEEHHYRVVAEAGNATEAMQQLRQTNPSMVILDIGLPGVRGIELAADILETRPQTQIIFLTVHKDEEYVYQALSIGAAGYVLKDCLDTEVIDAVRSVEKGGRYLTPLISSEIVSSLTSKNPQPFRSVFDGLTVRERQVVSLLCEGRSNKELASALNISARTVEHHRQAIMKKLAVHSIAELIKLAIRYKLIDI
jgi:two-component system, NarL family, response regulator NreC